MGLENKGGKKYQFHSKVLSSRPFILGMCNSKVLLVGAQDSRASLNKHVLTGRTKGGEGNDRGGRCNLDT